MPPTEGKKLVLAICKETILLVVELPRTLQGSLEFCQRNVNLINSLEVEGSTKVR